jgi:oligosaccharide repeat unit polymerase
MLFDPRLIFGLFWLAQIFGLAMFGDVFEPFSWLTWVSIVCTILGFGAGTLVAAATPVMDARLAPAQSAPDWLIRKAFYWFLVLYGFAAMLATAKLYLILRGELGAGMSMPAVRQAIVYDFTGGRQIFGLLRVFFFGVGACIYFLANAGSLTRRQLFVIVAVGLISAILTTGRLYMLLFFVAGAALFFRQGILTTRGVFATFGLFVGLFFLVAIVLQKGSPDSGLLEQLGWNTKVYALSSVACFDNYVQTGLQEIPGGALIPNAVRGLLDHLGLNVPLRPTLMPFVSVPLTCNTYTAMFPLYHDGQLPGIIFGFFALGLFHQFLFKWSSSSAKPIAWYLYAVSLYPLCMSVFEDAYFSSPGFWVLLWIPPVLHWLGKLMLKGPRKQAQVC